MKKICLTIFAILSLTQISFAQWTNGSGFVYTNNPVGINMTSTPNAPLEVIGNAIMGGTNISPGTVPSFPYLQNSRLMLIGWNRSGGFGETDFIANPGVGTTGGFSFYNCDNAGNLTLIMYARGDGNIGIGVTPSTSYKLNVNGTIHSKQVNVDLLGWSDYVFKKNYFLPALSEVKLYIESNHHLPGMPSESELASHGLNLGEMANLQNKKIEELTLYLIADDKQLQEQKEINTKQQSQIDAESEQLKSQQQQIDDLKQQLQLVLKNASGK